MFSLMHVDTIANIQYVQDVFVMGPTHTEPYQRPQKAKGRVCGAKNLLHRSLILKWISSHIMVSNHTVLTNTLISRHIWSSRKLAMMLLYLKVYRVRGSDVIFHKQIKFQNCKALWKMSKAVHLIFI